MRQARLIDRLERSGAEPPPRTHAHVLNDIARTLRETSARLEAARSTDDLRLSAAGMRPVPPEADLMPTPVLPQILTQVETESASHHSNQRARPSEPAGGQLLAPTILAGALVVVAILLSAAGSSVWHMSGPDRLSAATHRPKLAALAEVQPHETTPPADQAALALVARPALSLEEQMLLERCEEMIVRGDMQNARDQLAKAAAAGSVNAKFALAETFDPNVLAAWGLRERVADVAVARALYRQAMESGDPRASRRLDALGSEDL